MYWLWHLCEGKTSQDYGKVLHLNYMKLYLIPVKVKARSIKIKLF